MDKIRKFINESEDSKYISWLVIIFAVLLPLFYAHQGSLLIDCGREAYWPLEMLRGKVLYKELFNVYGPLSYQINALLYGIFGVSLFSLYNAGLWNSAVTIGAMYFIFKEITTKSASFIITLGTMILCVFNYYIFNFVFPYSYAFIYAFSTFLLALLFLIKYLKTEKQFFIPLSFFFIGISMASKYEYLIFLGILFAIAFWLKPVSPKNKIISVAAFLSVPAVSFGILLAQGLNFNDITTYLHYLKNTFSSPSLKYLYTGLFGKTYFIFLNIDHFMKFAYSLSILGAVFYFADKFKNTYKSWLLGFGSVALIIYFSKYLTDSGILSWLPISNALIFLGLSAKAVLKTIKEKISLKEYINRLSINEKIYFLLLFITVTISLKSFNYMSFMFYGALIFPLNFGVSFVFLINYLPNIVPEVNKTHWQKAGITFMAVFLTLLGLKNIISVQTLIDVPVKSQQGLIYGNKDDAQAFAQTISYFKKNSSPNDKVLVMPEGLMVNFLSNRKSINYYYSYLPLDLETFGEDKILKDIAQQMPEYIVINNRDSSDYGKPFFCKDYGQKICNYVHKNYKFEKQFGQGFVMNVYKRK